MSGLDWAKTGDWDSVVKYSDLLWARWARDQIPMEVRSSTPVPTGPVAHLAFSTVASRSLSQGLSILGVVLTTCPPYSAKVKERVELYLISSSGLSWPVPG